MATSLAPLPKALQTKAMVVRARIQSYLPVARGIIMDAVVASDEANSLQWYGESG